VGVEVGADVVAGAVVGAVVGALEEEATLDGAGVGLSPDELEPQAATSVTTLAATARAIDLRTFRVALSRSTASVCLVSFT
jgi:hypothetical protein